MLKTSSAVALTLCLIASGAQAVPLYRVLDLSYENVGSNRPNLGRAWSWADVSDINNEGVVVGNWQDNAFAYNIHTNSFLDRFTTTGNSYASGINDAEQIVGYAQDLPDGTGDPHLYEYNYHTGVYTVIQEGGTVPIGTPRPPSGVCASNAGNSVALCLDIANDGSLIWHQAYVGPSGAELLASIDPTLSYTTFTPYALNSRGIIVGNSGLRSLVLIPVNVPEPGTLALLSAGLLPLFWRRKRCRVTP